MTENLKTDLPRRTNINYRRNNLRKPNKKENVFLNRMLFRICTCAVILVFVFAVSKSNGERTKSLKIRLKNAVSQSITKDEIKGTEEFLKKYVYKIKKINFLNFKSDKKAEVYREKVYFVNNGSVIAENTINSAENNDKFG